MNFPHSGFMRRAELEDSPLLRDDRLTIQCDVTVIKEPLVLTNMFSNEITVPPPNITEHLGRLLETGVGADVTFIVDGEILAAHKLVLATRSPVFMAEFLGPMKEAKETHVAIEDMRSDAFRALPLLHFIYTDSLPDTDDARGDAGTELIQHLLVAADRYDVDRLKLMCESMLRDGLDVWNVAEVLGILAEAFEFKTSRLRKK
jgi:speckle-type POZ protein